MLQINQPQLKLPGIFLVLQKLSVEHCGITAIKKLPAKQEAFLLIIRTIAAA
jgi:GrpB-like predicted nucleotidyltransferase (UPF0157 family)